MILLVLGACLQAAAPAAQEPEGANPPSLHVQGNHLLSDSGDEVWLQGVNIPSLEWSAAGEHILESLAVAITNWRANVIRLPLCQDRWFGKAPHQDDGGKAYRGLVDQVVDYASSRRAYVLIDLHWSDGGVWGQNLRQHKMPDTNSIIFWQDAARRYANRPGVLFDLYNEPHDVSWEVWRNGGSVQEKTRNGETSSFESPGMQGLLDVVRATGARNVVIAGGLDWAYDLSGIQESGPLRENGGNGIAYATHVYPWKRNWDAKFGRVADLYPVFVGEVGCEPDKKHESPETWAPDILGYIQHKKLHWTAWCFHPSASPRLLGDWNYNPTPYWGVYVMSALAGKEFPLGKGR